MVDSTFLKNWLQRPDYQSGVAFYLLHGSNETLKKLFESGPTNFTRKKIQEEMAKLAKVPVEQPKPMVATDFVPVSDWALDKSKQRIELIKEQQHIRSQLLHYPNDEERKVAAFRVLEIVDLVMEIDDSLTENKKSGKVPVKDKPREGYDFPNWPDLRLQMHLVNSLRPRKTRAKGNAERLAELAQEELALMEELKRRKV